MATILAREVIPAAPFEAKPLSNVALVGPSPNIDGKRDRLPVIAALPQDALTDIDRLADAPLRATLDSAVDGERGALDSSVPLPRARGAARPALQKNYSLLSDMQIAAIRSRLRLTSAQDKHWPAVETALRSMARSMHERRQGTAPVNSETAAEEFEQLQTAAAPLLATLRSDQKQELRSLARMVGLEAVASRI